MGVEIIKIRSGMDFRKELAKAVRVLKSDGVIAYPTETFYGLGARADSQKAVERIFKIKKRKEFNPLLIIISSEDMLKDFVAEIPEAARMLIKRFWPGGLTIVFRAKHTVLPPLTGGTGKIGIRLSSHPISRAIVDMLGVPITGTSANISGDSPPTLADEVMDGIGKEIDLIVDGGKTEGGKPSTLIDVTTSPPRIIRDGAIPSHEIEQYI